MSEAAGMAVVKRTYIHCRRSDDGIDSGIISTLPYATLLPYHTIHCPVSPYYITTLKVLYTALHLPVILPDS